MRNYIPDDYRLKRLLRGEDVLLNVDGTPTRCYLAIENNNWWECFVFDPAGNFHDLMWALDADYYDEALSEIIVNMDNIINNLEDECVDNRPLDEKAVDEMVDSYEK